MKLKNDFLNYNYPSHLEKLGEDEEEIPEIIQNEEDL